MAQRVFCTAVGESEILQPPHFISRRLIGMAFFQSHHHRPNQLVADHQFNLPFLNLLDLPRFTYKRLTAIQRSKLTQTQHLPRAVVVSTDPPATGGEYGVFDLLHMTGRNKKAELIHSP